jgi:uncharacterized protein (TIGR02598 family)
MEPGKLRCRQNSAKAPSQIEAAASSFRNPKSSTEAKGAEGQSGRSLRNRSAFSLVEVVMAIGITSFAALSIVGLIPVGLNSFHQTKITGVATEISKQMFSEIGNASYTLGSLISSGTSWRLPAPNTTATYIRYFNEQGEELAATAGSTTPPAGAIYQANAGVRYASLLSGTLNSTNPCLVNVTIQVAYNPANLTLDTMATNSSLWKGTANSGAVQVPVYNFQTMVAGDPY